MRAEACEWRAMEGFAPIGNGIDVLIADDFSPLRGKRVALAANATSRTLDGRSTEDALRACDELTLTLVYDLSDGLVPEPQEEELAGVGALVYDVQDLGCAYAPHLAGIVRLLLACAEQGVRAFVLDRPNPLNGLDVEGPTCEHHDDVETAVWALPARHALTIGELARMVNREARIDADLRIVTMAGWQRAFSFAHTGQSWVPPLPGVDDPHAALLYPALRLLEPSNVDVGWAEGRAYRSLAAPWLDAAALAAAIQRRAVPGLLARAGDHRVTFEVTESQEFAPMDLALTLVRGLRAQHAGEWAVGAIDELLQRPDLIEAIEDGSDELEDLWQPDPDFFDVRARYLLYE